MMGGLIEFSQGDSAKYAALAEKAATRAETEGNWHKARTYWVVKARWHERQKDAGSKRNALEKEAECYVQEAESSLKKETPSYLVAVAHLEKAIEAHRRIGGNKARVDELHAYSDPNRHPFRWQNDTRSDRNRHLFRCKSAPLFRVS